jgi:hypothetical protein
MGKAAVDPSTATGPFPVLACAWPSPDNIVPFGARRGSGATRGLSTPPAPVAGELLRAVLGALVPVPRRSFHVLAVVSGLTQAEVRAAVAELVAAGLASLEERPDGYEPRQMVRITERGRGLFVNSIPRVDPAEAGDGS